MSAVLQTPCSKRVDPILAPTLHSLQTPRIEKPPTITFPFTRLPPEIRNAIYLLAIPQRKTITPSVPAHFQEAIKRDGPNRPFPSHETILALARTCKQIHDEVVPIYYGGNTFKFINIYVLYQFLYMIGHERRRGIKSIEVFLVNTGHIYNHGTKQNVALLREIEKWAFDLLADSLVLEKLCLGVNSYLEAMPNGSVVYHDDKPDGVVESFLSRYNTLDVTIGRARYMGSPASLFWIDKRSEWDGTFEKQ